MLKACLVRLLQRRKSRLKEVRSQNKSAHRIIVGCVGAPCTLIVLSNVPVPVPIKLQRIFLLRLCEGSLKRSSQTEDQSHRVCSPCSNKVRSTQAEFSIIKTNFQESKHDDDSFQFKRMSASPYGSVQGNAMAETPASLIAFT